MTAPLPTFVVNTIYGADDFDYYCFDTEHQARTYALKVMRDPRMTHVELLRVDGSVDLWETDLYDIIATAQVSLIEVLRRLVEPHQTSSEGDN